MSTLPWKNPQRAEALQRALAERILVLDGAMGTMIQRHELQEADYRGERFAEGYDALFAADGHAHGPGCGCEGHDQRGNNDLLTLTRPEIIRDIHAQYLAAGADLIETNTFNSTSISLADYRLTHLVRELNREGARIARETADAAEAKDPSKPRFVVGVLGPTSRTASLSPDVNRPGFRAISFDELRDAYREATDGLIEGGADILMVETVFDTLNAKAALFAIETVFDEVGRRVPVMISVTITDASGRTLSGQTIGAFYDSIRHSKPFSVGINCALGGREMRPYIQELSRLAECYVSCYPNAGLPNAFGGYDETPAEMAAVLGDFAKQGWINLVGGCCGSTPEHIAAIAQTMKSIPARQVAPPMHVMRLSGLESLVVA